MEKPFGKYLLLREKRVFGCWRMKRLSDLVKEDGVVVATGGGSACFHNNIQLMNSHGLTVYLKVSNEELVRRLSETKVDRPLLWGKSNDELTVYITEMLKIREPHYSKAQLVYPSDNLDAHELVEVLKPYIK